MLRLCLLSLFLLSVASCGTPGSHPSDMTVAEHEAAASKQAAAAEVHAEKYDPDAQATRRILYPWVGYDTPPHIRMYLTESYNPTQRQLAAAEGHEKKALEHSAAADVLRAYEDGACKEFAPLVRSSCPLMGQLERVEQLPKGARLVPKAGTNIDAWHDHIACHVAFAQAQVEDESAATCPLMLRGIHAEAVGNNVELTSDDAHKAAQLMTLAQQHVQ